MLNVGRQFASRASHGASSTGRPSRPPPTNAPPTAPAPSTTKNGAAAAGVRSSRQPGAARVHASSGRPLATVAHFGLVDGDARGLRPGPVQLPGEAGGGKLPPSPHAATTATATPSTSL
jgi:hypothetical protein